MQARGRKFGEQNLEVQKSRLWFHSAMDVSTDKAAIHQVTQTDAPLRRLAAAYPLGRSNLILSCAGMLTLAWTLTTFTWRNAAIEEHLV